MDVGNVGEKGSDAGRGIVVAEEGEGGLGKGALVQVDKEAVGFENVEKLGEMREVGRKIKAGNKNVIQVDKKEGKAMEETIYEPLECLGGILEAERHFEELEEAKGSDHRRFGDVRRSDRNLVVALEKTSLEKMVAL